MIWRIRSRKVFGQLRDEGRRVRSGPVRMTFVALPSPQPQVAMALGRRFGTAVERNRARRRLRSAFGAAWQSGAGPAGAYLLTGNRSLLTMPFEKLVTRIDECLAAAGESAIGAPRT